MPKTQFFKQSSNELFITSNDLISILNDIKSSNHNKLNKKHFELALNLIQSRKNGKLSPEDAYRLYKNFKKIKRK